MTRVASWSIDRGRQFELDNTDVGRATVVINDTDGTYDPTNTGGPYYGNLDPMKQIAIALQNPVTDNWLTVFRGHISDFAYTLDPAQGVMVATISCVDALEILSDGEIPPYPLAGDAPPPNSDVFYEGAEVDDRIIQVLGDAGFSSDWYTRAGEITIFAGNVVLQDSTYSSGSKYLEAIQDAADAEFPGVANFLVDKEGIFMFLGRFARFDPTTTAATRPGAWTFREWACGDGAAVAADPSNVAQLRGMSFNRSKEQILNAALCYPMHFDDPSEGPGVLTDQIATNPDPLPAGTAVRSWSKENLLTYGSKTGPNVGSGLWGEGGAQRECKLFADYIVANYAAAANRISQLVFRPLAADDSRAAPLWDLMCNVEISDTISVLIAHPGGGGFNDTFYVEGIHYDTKPGGDVPDVTLTLDVSPTTYFDTDPFS